MRSQLIIALILISLAACNKAKPDKDIIPPETLVPVLIDLHVTYAIQTSPEFRTISRKVDSIDPYSYVFNKHDITKELFDSTIAWYSSHPDLFTAIYDEVVMQLTQAADSLNPEIQ